VDTARGKGQADGDLGRIYSVAPGFCHRFDFLAIRDMIELDENRCTEQHSGFETPRGA
jgi:hypothetical protein